MLDEARQTAQHAAEGVASFGWLTYLWVFLLSFLGGLNSYIKKVRSGELKPVNLLEFLGEITSSALAGVLTFWLCAWANTPELLSAVLIGVSGHMGSRAISALEVLWGRFVTGVLRIEVDQKDEPK